MPRSSSGISRRSRDWPAITPTMPSIASATKRGNRHALLVGRSRTPACLRQQHAVDAGLAPANGAPPELGVEGDHRGRPWFHQAPEPGRGVVRCSSSSSDATGPGPAFGIRSMTHRTASTMIVGSLTCGKWLEPAAWKCRLSGARATRASWFVDRRSATSSGICRPPVPGRGHDGERHIGELRGMLDLATRVIDHAGFVEPAIPAQRIAELKKGVQGTGPAGLQVGHRPVVGVRRLDQHHATHVIRQPPGNSCTYSPPRE